MAKNTLKKIKCSISNKFVLIGKIKRKKIGKLINVALHLFGTLEQFVGWHGLSEKEKTESESIAPEKQVGTYVLGK